ncbi:hypothetical protein OAI46_04415 [Alphaproteobacteria bacterium]|nr:hypothetical protein [Alphaproteobacteria bacterium]MDC1241142.1 hypothetical protein [bacterium]
MPPTPHSLRAAARDGREGRAVTLCAPEEQNLLRDIEKLIKRNLPVENMAHQPAGSGDESGYNPMQSPAAKPPQKSDKSSYQPAGDAPKMAKNKRRRQTKRNAQFPQNAEGPRKKGGNKNPPRGPARRAAARRGHKPKN